MNIYTTQSRHGILNHSRKTPGETEGYCRATEYKRQLFCVFINGPTAIGPPMVMSRSAGTDWDPPVKLLEDFHGYNTPTLFTFAEGLYALVPGVLGNALLLSYNDRARGFTDSRLLGFSIDGTPSTAVLNNELYVFYRTKGSRNVFYTSSADLQVWSRSRTLKIDGSRSVLTDLCTSVVTYQGLVQVIYKSDDKTFDLLQFDGEGNWTRARQLVTQPYAFDPAVVVHNGLLKLIFSERAGSDYSLWQYSFDGHSISGPVQSTELSASRSIAAAVLDGELVLMYRGAP